MAQEKLQPEYMDTLKKERDRFVALAFCAADILFEVDKDQKITYAAGATKALTDFQPHDVIGKSFIELIDSAERDYVGRRLEGLGSANRLEPMMVRMSGPNGPTPRLMLTGYHLPDLPGSFFFALRLTSKDEKLDDTNDPRRDTETGLLNKEAFAEFATQRIKDAEAEGEELKVTMLRLEDMGDLRTRLDAESDKDLMRTLGHCFDNGAGDRDVAAKFDDENYGLLHDDGFDVDALRERLESHLKAAMLRGDRQFVIEAIAVLGETDVPAVRKAFSLASAKGVAALSWKAGLSAELAHQLQLRLAKVSPSEAIKPRGGNYGMSEKDLAWQVEFFGG
jgi:GGDEF domain-containing protein